MIIMNAAISSDNTFTASSFISLSFLMVTRDTANKSLQLQKSGHINKVIMITTITIINLHVLSTSQDHKLRQVLQSTIPQQLPVTHGPIPSFLRTAWRGNHVAARMGKNGGVMDNFGSFAPWTMLPRPGGTF